MSAINSGLDPVGPRHTTTVSNYQTDRISAVSWAAIIAGATTAAALSVLLFILGTGLGLSAVSPWSMEGISATAIGFSAIGWLCFTQLAASGMGGYVAGRLRSNWAPVHDDEVYFRDYTHGFLTWAAASLLMAVVLASAIGSIVSGGAKATAVVASGAAGAVGAAAVNVADSDGVSGSIEYYIESLFRGSATDPAGASEIPVGEVTRIFVRALRSGTLDQDDRRYVGQLIAQRTNLSQQEAERRVSEGFTNVQATLEEAEVKAREIADDARKASAIAALLAFITLVLGALAASLMAVFGGRVRDS